MKYILIKKECNRKFPGLSCKLLLKGAAYMEKGQILAATMKVKQFFVCRTLGRLFLVFTSGKILVLGNSKQMQQCTFCILSEF